MANQWGIGVPDSAIIMLAKLMLARIKLKGMKVDNRQDAIAIIRGLKPAVSKDTPLHAVLQSAVGKTVVVDRCSSCGKPLLQGELCRTLWTMHDGEHIRCQGNQK